MLRLAPTPALMLGLWSVAVAACGDDSIPPEVTTADTTSGGTTGGTDTGADTTGAGGSTLMGGTGDTGDTGPTTTGLDDTSSSDGSSEGSTGDGFCLPEEPGCGCDGVDVPDASGTDENDDGLDGLRHCSVFVSELGGNDGNDGLTPDTPVATIGRGIEISQGFVTPRPVLVAEGTYPETVTVANGTSLYGGYDASSWTRNTMGNVTTIEGTQARAMIVADIDTPTEIDGFTIVAADFASASASTYGVWIDNATAGNLHIDYCTVMAGSAGSGAAGASGSNGANGGSGTAAVTGTGGTGGASACGANGGSGGDGDVCPSENGQDGQAGGDPTTVGVGGPAGSSNCDGCFDSASPGSAGSAGSVGLNGEAGMVATDDDGSFAMSGLWTPAAATAATRGLHGGGGGGGGAGGFDSDPLGCDINLGAEPCSGGGGGGGAGGCGGEGGEAGAPGGGSFAMVVLGSEVSLTNSEVVLGTGGHGGDGGDGGDGGTAGGFGAGSPPCACSGCGEEPEPGDEGAPGGGGGGGGGGPGGCGGVAIGIASVNGAMVTTSNVGFSGGVAGTPGDGGLGGTRADGLGTIAPSGATGCTGIVADEWSY